MHTLGAIYGVMTPAHPALKDVRGRASIKVTVACPAQHHAIAFHVIDAVRKSSAAATNAQVSAVNSVQMTIAKSVQSTEMLVSMCLK